MGSEGRPDPSYPCLEIAEESASWLSGPLTGRWRCGSPPSPGEEQVLVPASDGQSLRAAEAPHCMALGLYCFHGHRAGACVHVLPASLSPGWWSPSGHSAHPAMPAKSWRRKLVRPALRFLFQVAFFVAQFLIKLKGQPEMRPLSPYDTTLYFLWYCHLC